MLLRLLLPPMPAAHASVAVALLPVAVLVAVRAAVAAVEMVAANLPRLSLASVAVLRVLKVGQKHILYTALVIPKYMHSEQTHPL